MLNDAQVEVGMGRKTKEIVDYKSYNIPETLKVGAVNYKVIFPYLFDEDSAYVGLHEYETLTIKLGIMSPSHQSQYLPKQKIYQYFLHEIMHAIDSIFCDCILTESEVDKLSMAWHSILTESSVNIRKNSNVIPKHIKIFSLYYDVKYLNFKDIEDQSICSSNCCTIEMSKDVENVEPQLQKMLLVYMINCLIDRIFEMRFTYEKNEDLNKVFRCFSSGLYQVLYENDLESMFRCLRHGKK
jgi:hypothetical protein